MNTYIFVMYGFVGFLGGNYVLRHFSQILSKYLPTY